MKIEDIVTDRLILRGFTKDDALWAFSIWNDPEMGKFLPDEAMEKIDPEYLKMLEGLGDDDECCYLIPVSKDTGERVGTCSFIGYDDGKTIDIAYCVHKSLWNKGYATEIAKALVDYAKANNAEKVTILVSKENVASNRVAQKLGGVIVDEHTYEKRGSDQKMLEYTYEIKL